MESTLQALLAPRSIAVIGASDHIHKIGGRPIHYMQTHGYAGTLYPVNPQRDTIQGLRAYPSLDALPAVPELAIIVVAGDAAVQAVRDCARLGVAAAIVIASGFGEAGPEGKRQQDEMVRVAAAAGLRLVGPNSQGLANFGSGTIASFSTMFIEVPPRDGPVAVVSQSGGVSAMVYGLLRGQGIGVRHMHATGNEADITVSELALAVAHDEHVRLILLYLESLTDPAVLARAAATARARGVPMVAVKAGAPARDSVPRPRTPAPSPTRIARSMPSCGTTASGAWTTRMRWHDARRCICAAGGPVAGAWSWSAIRGRAA